MKPRTFITLGAALVAMLTPGCIHYNGWPMTNPPTYVKPDPPRKIDGGVSSVERVSYHGWKNALRMRNKMAEVVVVPEIGRVMSFRLRAGENVFWEDHSLDGQRGDAGAKDWINFGGDKTWPAPESDWSKFTKRKEWRPPPAFDSLPVKVIVDGSDVMLTSPVDPFYGVRTTRRVHLYENILQITTTYERITGEPAKMGVWVITQFKDPVGVYVPVKTNSIFADGHFKFSPEPWPQLQRHGEHLAITRDPKTAHKMGSDVEQLIWVGEKEICAVSSSRLPGGEYPDRGASAEVYTNPDPKKYIEIEMLGPLSLMKPGNRISRTSVYTLSKRLKQNPDAELP